mmetsp:Transcript_2947/g.7974  ORF Transcript_2947/g.7974 Transcript_2947/m.7974 type:complete len:226 (-) Transcript_2947:78-755(-)
MVVPAGEVTMSFSSPGCLPVSSTILAAPMTVWAASFVATGLGRPDLTPPSDRASIMRKTYAGPLPLRPVTASRKDSSTDMVMPTVANRDLTSSTSDGVTSSLAAIADADSPTRQGVFGMIRTTLALGGSKPFKVSMVTPAAMERTSLLSQLSGDTVLAVAPRYCGFTARIATSQFATAESFESCTLHPSSSAKTLLRASEMSYAFIFELVTTFFAMNPFARASAI